MDGNRIRSFPPIADSGSRVLVLGTMPGAESLRRQQYYAFGRNNLWAVIFALYGRSVPDDYDDRVRFLLDNRIALWDVLASCERRGSADAQIKKAEPNDIIGLLNDYPGIGAVFLNGHGAEALFRKLVLPRLPHSVHIDTLPSTSPAYAIAFERKLEGWGRLLEILSKIQ